MRDINYSALPEHMQTDTRLYIEEGVMYNKEFLYYIFANNLVGAAKHADDINLHNLHVYASFLYNYAPIECWGSEIKIQRWTELGGLHGHEQSIKDRQGDTPATTGEISKGKPSNESACGDKEN